MKRTKLLNHVNSPLLSLLFLTCLLINSVLLSSCTKTKDETTKISFTAEVVSASDHTLLVRPEDGTIEYQICSQIYVPTDTLIVDSNGNRLVAADLITANRVQITYDGVLDNSDPAQISSCYEILVLE